MLPRKRYLSVALTILLLVRESTQYGSGAPAGACADQTPRHSGIEVQTSVPPYMIQTTGSQVRQGDVLNVTIGSPAGAPVPIGGFILQARQIQNPDTIVGKFVRVPPTTHLVTCSETNDTVTHNTPEEKGTLTFQWQAPTDFLGGVEFRATVAQSYATFWKNVESSLVEVVTPETDISTMLPPITIKYNTQPPPIIMENKPKATAPALDVIYQGCSDNKLCFGVPQNCVQKGDCKAIVAIFVSGEDYTFEIQGTGNPKYVAAALSLDAKMGDDSAMECVRNDNGRVSLFTSWTYPKVEPYVRRSDSPQDIVQLLESSVIDGKLYCKFKRNVVSTVQGITFDLASNMYNLMVVSGDSMKDADRVGFHNVAYEATGEAMALSSVGAAASASKLLLKLHGSFMLVAWIATASLGILLARYFKQTWEGKQLGGKDIWFAYHRILMIVTWSLTMIGFILIVAEVRGWTGGDNPHAITGIITVILCFIQPIGAYFRPHPGTEKRVIFNWAHWFVGNAAHILGIVSIFLAVYLPKAELPGWSVYILAAFVAFHVVMHVVLSATWCVGDRGSVGVTGGLAMKHLAPHSSTPATLASRPPHHFSGFKKLMLGVYAPVILILVIAMIFIVARAPLGDTDSLLGV